MMPEKLKRRMITRSACPMCRKSQGLAGTAMVPAQYRRGAWRTPKQVETVMNVDCPCGWCGGQSDLISIEYESDLER